MMQEPSVMIHESLLIALKSRENIMQMLRPGRIIERGVKLNEMIEFITPWLNEWYEDGSGI